MLPPGGGKDLCSSGVVLWGEERSEWGRADGGGSRLFNGVGFVCGIGVKLGIKSGTPRVLKMGRGKRRVHLDGCEKGGVMVCFCPGSGASKYATRTYDLHSGCSRLHGTNCRIVNMDMSSRGSRRGFVTGGRLPFALVTSASGELMRRFNM